MKTQLLSKYRLSLVLLIILAVVLSVIPSCGGGGGGSGPPPAPVSPPYTTASPVKDIYAAAQSVTLTANRPATIYYSLDGDLPSIGKANTISGPSPLSNILIAQDTNLLQFFARDSEGRLESVRSETYIVTSGTASGPGDEQNYYPLTVGNTWLTRVTVTETGSRTYTDITTITGTKIVSGVTTFISKLEETPGYVSEEEYLYKSSNGLISVGANDPSDIQAAQMVPFPVAMFPPLPGSSFVSINKALDSGEDLDWDGINEVIDLYFVHTITGLGTATVPAGTFPDCLMQQTSGTLTITLSSTQEKFTSRVTATAWFAPNVGTVKFTSVQTYDDGSDPSMEAEELTGGIVEGIAYGDISGLPARTNEASQVTDTSATLNGSVTVDPLVGGTVWFEYGTTTAYGNTTNTYWVNSSSWIGGAVTGLQQQATYHFRVVLKDASGTVSYGQDKSFRTLATPQIIASGLNSVGYITANSSHIYWIESVNGTSIRKVGNNGGDITTLVTDLVAPGRMAFDVVSVYWTDTYGLSVAKVGLNGGPTSTLASSQYPIDIAVDPTSVYWTESMNISPSIKKVGKDGGDVVVLATGLSSPSDIAVDSSSVYWHEDNAIKKVGINGGTATILAPVSSQALQSSSRNIAVDSANVYWMEYSTLKAVPLSGGTVTTLLADLLYPHGFVTDSTAIYYIESSWPSMIKKINKDGSGNTTLAIVDYVTGLAVDSTNLYWSDGGSMYKIPKN